MKWLLLIPIHIYRWTISPVLGNVCRFTPTCSQYALTAIERHGAFYGGWLAIKRICRCNPWCDCGIDNVPE